MVENKELKKIKKMYGENFMKLCRELFPTLLEKEGRLFEVLNLCFAGNSRTLYEDIVSNELQGELKDYIYSQIDVEDPEKRIIEERTPYQLLEEAGYELTECLTEEEIQGFKKYYAPGEALCTFNGGRLNRCVVFFAVKKDVEKIRRKDFSNPKREDEYGTSVMGIQFNRKGRCTVSIKNRYNHTVNNPDATYGNDLNRIIPGLEQSFERLLHERGLELNGNNVERFEIPNYVVASDGKYYKYNMESNGNYYCPGNIIIENGEAHKLENPEKQLLIDKFVLDIGTKTIKLYDEKDEDSFVDGIKDIEKIEITKGKENGTRIIAIQTKDNEQPIMIEIDKDNQIIGYKNPHLKQIGDKFLYYCYGLKKVEIPQVEKVGNDCFVGCYNLEELDVSNLKEAGDHFLSSCDSLKQLKAPQLKRLGDWCIRGYIGTQLELPQLEKVGDDFFESGYESYFLDGGKGTEYLKLPQLKQAGERFAESCFGLRKVELPQLEKVGTRCLSECNGLEEVELPQLKEAGSNLLYCCDGLKKVELPQLEKVGCECLSECDGLEEVELPHLKEAIHELLSYCYGLKKVELPQLEKVEHGCLMACKNLKELKATKLKQIGEDFLSGSSESVEQLEIPQLEIEQLDRQSNWELIDLVDRLKQKQNLAKKDEKQEIKVDPKKIAELDKDTQLTTAEVNSAKQEIESIGKNNKKKEENNGR